jgi:beta-fructofuranosidase
VSDAKAPLTLKAGEHELNLRIFMDRSVLEVFANDTVCITKIIAPFGADPRLGIRAVEGAVTVKRLEAWPMKTIW